MQNWSGFANMWESTKYNEKFTKTFTFSEWLGKYRKTHNLILQFLLIVKSVVERNQFFWCFIEHEYMLHWYRKKYLKSKQWIFGGKKMLKMLFFYPPYPQPQFFSMSLLIFFWKIASFVSGMQHITITITKSRFSMP